MKNTFQSTNTFRSTENTFQSKKNLVWFPRKCFPFWLCLFFGKWFPETTFQTFMYLFSIRKVGQQKTFSSQRKIWLGFQESVFLKNLNGKHFPEVVKNLKISLFADYINLIVKLLIAIYNLFWIFIFQFHLLKFNLYINFGHYFYNFYLLFSYHFFIEIFYLSNLVLILLIVTYFIWNNLWNVNYYYFNFFTFYFFFNFLDLISIILIIIYFI